jgi:eukaryotic-like serine/threonine-protein kinase
MPRHLVLAAAQSGPIQPLFDEAVRLGIWLPWNSSCWAPRTTTEGRTTGLGKRFRWSRFAGLCGACYESRLTINFVPECKSMADLFMGRYVSLGVIGQGSMGEVYLAHPVGMPDRRVVVKKMHPEIAADPHTRKMFEAEIQCMTQLRHPYIVQILDSSCQGPHGPCLVMEYVPGVTLEALLEKQKRLSMGQAGLLLGHLCRALYAAHSVNIVHRDLKPSNLMVVGSAGKSLRVMDFGIAQFTHKPHFTAERLAGSGFAHMHAAGTPSYISPEALRGDTIDARADIYSVGIILFEMLTGQPPFTQRDMYGIMHAHVHEPPLSFAAVGARGLPRAVESVVQVCLSKYPVERPRSAKEVARQFSKAIGVDIWAAVRPAEALVPVSAPPKASTLAPTQAPAADQNAIVHQMAAYMPEALAVVKLRGFLEDMGAKVVASEPGLLRIRLGRPAPAGSAPVKPPNLNDQYPVEIEMRMEKAGRRGDRLNLTVMFRPFADPLSFQVPEWRNRCQKLYTELRSYLMVR